MNKFKLSLASIVFFLFCSSLNAQVLLNEVMAYPANAAGGVSNQGIVTGKEYIELYNTSCTSINVSGYFISCRQDLGTGGSGGTFMIPNIPEANIPPNSHIVIGSPTSSTVASNIDIKIVDHPTNYCSIFGKFLIANYSGWVGLYNASGTPIDAIYWSDNGASSISSLFDYGGIPCMPSSSPAGIVLLSAQQINTSFPSLIKYAGVDTFPSNFTYSRIPDGGNWQDGLAPSISNAAPAGNCNGGTCVIPSVPAAPSVTTPINYCQNTVANQLTATVLSGGTLNWYGTNATTGTATTTAPTPITTTTGTTTYYVSQTVGGCESPRAAIVVNVTASSSIGNFTCGTPTTTSVNFTWTGATGATGYSISYQINNTGTIFTPTVTGLPVSYSVNSLNSGDSVTIIVTPTGAAGTCFSPSSLTCATLVNNACGTCATPTCPILGVANYSSLNFASSCNSWNPQPSNTTLTNYYLVQSDASGFLGIAQQATSTPLCMTRSAVIRPLISSCNVASNISPSVTNANGVGSGFNPEWYGLTPNTQYVVVETVVLTPTCFLTALCTNYYGCSTPTTPVASQTVSPTCSTPTGTIVVSSPAAGSGNLYSVDGINYQPSATFSGLTPATYTVTVKKTPSGCISAGTSVIVNAVPSAPTAPTLGTITQPTCLISTGSVVLNGLPSGNWTINPGAISGSTPTTTISLLASGSYTFTVTNAAGCISAGTPVTINTVSSAPTAPTLGTIIHPTCSFPTGSVVLNGLPTGNWTINPGGITGSTTSTTISGLTSGTTNYTVTNAAGCISLASANVLINVQPSTPTAPTLGTITQPTCLISTGSVVLNGLPSGNWTINPGGITGSTASTTITGLTSGTTNYTVTNAAGCISLASANVLINVQPSTPTAPTLGTITQPTCLISTGSVVLNGLPTGNWTINPGAISGSTTSTTITGLTSGTTNYTVTNAAGCISLASANVLINVQPSTPTAPTLGTITQPTCLISTGSVILNGLPTGNWTINPSAITGSTASTTITGLTTGTTNYTVTNAAGCISLASANVLINVQPSTPTAPTLGTITQPTCLISTGSVVLNGLPTGNWTINPGAISGSTTSTTITGLTSGTTNYTVTNAAGCVSLASANVLILTAPPAAAPIFAPISPICYGTIISLPLNSTNGVSGTWLPLFDPTTTTTYTFTPDPGQCSSTTTLLVTVLPNPTVIATPTTETICSLQSTGIVLSGSISGTTFSWVPSTTTVLGAVSDSGTIISQVLTATTASVGSVVYAITPSYNGCSGTPISVSIFVTPKPILSVSPASQTICSGTSTAIALSSSMLNTNYSWNVIGTNVSGDLAGTGSIISQILTVGTTSGNAVYSIVPNVNGCPGTPIEVTINVNPIPTLTINPVLGQTICSGETTAISLSSSVTNTTFSWAAIQNNINGSGSGNGNTIAQTLSTIIPALGTVTYTITPVSNGCIGASGSVLVNVKPTPEIFGIPSQLPICSGDSTNIVINPTLIGTTFSWTVNPIGVSGATIGSGSSIIQALETTGNTFGTVVYSLTPTLNLCSGLPIDIPVKVNPLPLPTLTAGVICVDASGIAFQTYILDTGLNSTDYTFEWSINGVLQSGVGATFEALVAGNYSVIATNILIGCISIPTFSVVTPSFPATGLTAELTSAYFSENGTITATVTGGNGTYLFALDDGALQTSNVFENVAPGQHTVSVKDTNGCTNLLPVTLNTIGYPTYFTPNGDGIHDTWNIIGLENQPTAKVYVFDRYGKLIKQISTRSSGWDGTYNGNPMPSSDYWFTIDYLEPGAKVFKAHFSLKR